MISIFSSSRYKIDRKLIRTHVVSTLSRFGIDQSQNFSIAFVGKRKMKEISKNYKNENIALPVLIFPYGNEKNTDGETGHVFAEIVICYPQAVLLAAEREKEVNTTIANLITHAISNIA